MMRFEIGRFARLTAALSVLVSAAHAKEPTAASGPSAPPPTAVFTPSEPGPSDAPDEPESSDVSEARAAFRLGSALAKQGQWLDALAAFGRSARMNPHPITMYNVAYCERALGHYARAYKNFSAALEPAATPGGPKLPAELETQARGYLVETEQRVARISVAFVAPNMAMRVDGHPLEPLRATGDRAVLIVAAEDAPVAAPSPSTFDLWLDPGTHVFVVSRPGSDNVVESHAFRAGESAALRFPTEPSATPAPSTVSPSAEAPQVSHGPNRTAAIVAFSVGGAALVTSGVFAGLALNEKGSLPNCQGHACPAEDQNQMDRMKRFADFATVGLVVGGVGAGLGTYLWLSANGSSEKPSGEVTAATVRPWIGLGSAGVAGKF
jgi:hypothetical protein